VEPCRAINVVRDIAEPVEEVAPQTITMFKRIQTILRVLAFDWPEPQAQPAMTEQSWRHFLAGDRGHESGGIGEGQR